MYNTRGGPKEGVLNVHVVPHSHDDVGKNLWHFQMMYILALYNLPICTLYCK